jgi:hypothetical protein
MTDGAENVSVQCARGKLWRRAEEYGVRVRALNLALRGVHMHKKVCVVYTHTIRVRRVYAVLAERRGVWLAHAQYGYMLSHDSLVWCAQSIDAWWGHIELWHGAMHREKCMWNISARYKNCAQRVIVQEPKLCAVVIGARHKSARMLLARQRSDTQWF